MSVYPDLVESCIKSSCAEYVQSGKQTKVLGFEIDMKLQESSKLHQEEFYHSDSRFLVSEVPGTTLLKWSDKDKYVFVSYQNRRYISQDFQGNNRGNTIYTSGEMHNTADNTCSSYCNILEREFGLRIKLGIVYDGTYLLVSGVSWLDEEMSNSWQYVDCVLLLHRLLTDTNAGYFSMREESIRIIQAIDQMEYVPITTSYLEILEKVTNAQIYDTDILVNPKYDGSTFWIYVSDSVPLSLVCQYRMRGTNRQRYVGRLSNLRLTEKGQHRVLLCERIQQNGKTKYIALDCFSSQRQEYIHRKLELLRFFREYRLLLPSTMQCGESKLFRLSRTKQQILQDLYVAKIPVQPIGSPEQYVDSLVNYSNFPSTEEFVNNLKLSIWELMKPDREFYTDGLIFYIAGQRPLKLKKLEDMTVDVEYTRTVQASGLVHKWGTRNKDLLAILSNVVPTDAQCPEDAKMYILEIAVNRGLIKRVRADRKAGNPDMVISNVMEKYTRDKKYSSEDVWCGKNLKFPLLAGRMFKRYCYLKYIPDGQSILDLGSGNGGDLSVWTEKKFYVLAVEKADERFRRLRNACKNYPKISCRHRSMEDIIPILQREARSYKYACFMRSIGHLGEIGIRKILAELYNYGVEVVVIVTMVADNLQRCTMVDSALQYFQVWPGQGNQVKVTYKIGEKQRTQYEDFCYSIESWQKIAADCKYTLSYEREGDFLNSVFNFQEPEKYSILAACVADCCFVLRSA